VDRRSPQQAPLQRLRLLWRNQTHADLRRAAKRIALWDRR